jgi:hypothetical protein
MLLANKVWCSTLAIGQPPKPREATTSLLGMGGQVISCPKECS